MRDGAREGAPKVSQGLGLVSKVRLATPCASTNEYSCWFLQFVCYWPVIVLYLFSCGRILLGGGGGKCG